MPNRLLPLALVTSLFFLWALAHNLNPILIPHLKKACRLTDFQSAWIDSAFFIAYFLFAVPAGIVMKRYGYKSGIILGLLLFAAGAFLFYPAATLLSFPSFLLALFVIASGLTFLETAANPYITVLGPPESAAQRLNLAQSFNGLGAFLAPLIGGMFILSGKEWGAEELAGLSPQALSVLYAGEAAAVKAPYIVIGLLVLAVAVVFSRVSLPDIKDGDTGRGFRWGHLLRHRPLKEGVVAQFFYVGAQVGVGSFFIRFLKQSADIGEKQAAYFLSLALLLFMVGRFVGTFLMKWVAPARLLALYALCNMALLAFAVGAKGLGAAHALMGVEFFMSIMFPTIFSLSIAGLGDGTKMGASLLIMSIIGGAIVPLAMGRISDLTHSIQTAYLVPLLCFAAVFYFGWKNRPAAA